MDIPECPIPRGVNTFSYQGGDRKSLIPIPQRLKKNAQKLKKRSSTPIFMIWNESKNIVMVNFGPGENWLILFYLPLDFCREFEMKSKVTVSLKKKWISRSFSDRILKLFEVLLGCRCLNERNVAFSESGKRLFFVRFVKRIVHFKKWTPKNAWLPAFWLHIPMSLTTISASE